MVPRVACYYGLLPVTQPYTVSRCCLLLRAAACYPTIHGATVLPATTGCCLLFGLLLSRRAACFLPPWRIVACSQGLLSGTAGCAFFYSAWCLLLLRAAHTLSAVGPDGWCRAKPAICPNEPKPLEWNLVYYCTAIFCCCLLLQPALAFFLSLSLLIW